jgi:hypothetical protein
MRSAFETAKDRDQKIHRSTRAGLSPHTEASINPILALQQQAGNQAVQEFLRNGLIKAKLAISQPDDPDEREADDVADRIMRKHAGGPVSSGCSCAEGEETCEECRTKHQGVVARKATSVAEVGQTPPLVAEVLRAPGQPLSGSARASVEQEFGHDLGGVRVHHDSRAAESASAVNALAYTLGNHIVFGAGRYTAGTKEGDRLLVHELTHVIQQAGNRTTSAHLQRQADPSKAEEAAGARLRALATRPSQAIAQWHRLQNSEQSFVVMTMAGRYGTDFAQEFLNYAEGRKKPDLSTEVTNTETAQSLTARGFRFAGDSGGVPLWVHPSGHEVQLLSPGKKAPASPEETPRDRAFRLCSDTLMMVGPDACSKCCDQKITGSDEYDIESKKACKELCGG